MSDTTAVGEGGAVAAPAPVRARRRSGPKSRTSPFLGVTQVGWAGKNGVGGSAAECH